MDEESSKPLLSPEDEVMAGTGPTYYYPPPAYEPSRKPVVLMSVPLAPPPISEGAMPLPTYDQSEKFEKEGVLEYSDQLQHEGTVRFVSQRYDATPGSSCEFMVFFLISFFLSWLGYLISCCLATNVAAQSGAAAGLGLSLVLKTIFVEIQPHYLINSVHSLCNDDDYYGHTDVWTDCTKRYYSFLRMFFFILGFLGLFMFARGISVFCQTRPRPRNDECNA